MGRPFVHPVRLVALQRSLAISPSEGRVSA